MSGQPGVAERMRPADLRSLLNHFYQAAAHAVDKELGVVDKFLGDGFSPYSFRGSAVPTTLIKRSKPAPKSSASPAMLLETKIHGCRLVQESTQEWLSLAQ